MKRDRITGSALIEHGDAGGEMRVEDGALTRLECRLRTGSSNVIYLLEAGLYIAVAILLSITAVVVTFQAAAILWRGANDAISKNGLLVLDQLLLVLMLVEIIHTVRISLRSKELILLEPFLIVGLIASIRRVLVITLQAATLAQGSHATVESAASFRNAMIELGLLGFFVLVLVFSIYLLRKGPSAEPLPIK